MIPQRYKDIKNYIEGLQVAGLLEGNKSKLTFLNSEKYWCSHLILFSDSGEEIYSPIEDSLIKKVNSDLFGIYFMKNKDRIWVKSNIYAYSRSELIMMNNSFIDDLKKVGRFQVKIDIPESFYQNEGKVFVRILIEHHHSLDDIYNLYQFFRKYQNEKRFM